MFIMIFASVNGAASPYSEITRISALEIILDLL